MAAIELSDVDVPLKNVFYCASHEDVDRRCGCCRGCAGPRPRPYNPMEKASMKILAQCVDQRLKPPHKHLPLLGGVGAEQIAPSAAAAVVIVIVHRRRSSTWFIIIVVVVIIIVLIVIIKIPRSSFSL